jgi:5S rRNA maturation endonuclease (ribonuclease M5)
MHYSDSESDDPFKKKPEPQVIEAMNVSLRRGMGLDARRRIDRFGGPPRFIQSESPANPVWNRPPPPPSVRRHVVANPVEKVLGELEGVTKTGDQQWSARCPAHDDNRASLSISLGQDGRVLLHCHAGCTFEEVLAAADLKASDLLSPTNRGVVATYDYHTAEGELVYQVVRYAPKDFRQRRPDGRGGWISNMDGVTRIPYRLPELLQADAPQWVFVCEGEKDVDNVRSKGLVATCNVGGAGKWRPEYSEVLRGRRVCIIADKDLAGRKHAQQVATALQGISAEVKIIECPGDSIKDASDWVDAGGTAEQLKATAETAPAWDSASVPCITALPFVPFPTDELPAPLASFIREEAEAIVCDESGIALFLLAGLASAIGNCWQIRIRDEWYEPAILWVMLVAVTGSKKTPIIRAAFQFVYDRQRALDEKYQCDLAEYDRAVAEWTAQPKDTRPVEKPVKPKYPHAYADDSTIEGLASILKDALRGLALIKDELSRWWQSFNAYKNGGGDEQAYLSLYNALPLKIDRKSADQRTIFIPRASVTIAGGIQPSVLRAAFTPERYANGLASRFVFAYPPEKDGPAWTDVRVNPATRQAVADIFTALHWMEPTAGKPETMNLSSEATALYCDFVNALKIERLAMGDSPLAGAWSKFEAMPGRLALILQLVSNVVSNPSDIFHRGDVTEETMRHALAITRWLMNETRRVYLMLGQRMESPEDIQHREQAKLFDWIRAKGGKVTPRELRQHNQSRYPRSEDAEVFLSKLVKAGFGQWHIVRPEGPGQPAKYFVLI